MASQNLHCRHLPIGQLRGTPEKVGDHTVVALPSAEPRTALAINDHGDTVEGRTDNLSLLASSVSAYEQRARDSG